MRRPRWNGFPVRGVGERVVAAIGVFTLVATMLIAPSRDAEAVLPSPEGAAIAAGLTNFALVLDQLGGFEELGDNLPLTDATPSDALGLVGLFSDTLGAELATLPPVPTLAEIEAAIVAAADAGKGIAFNTVSVVDAGATIDADFSVSVNPAAADFPFDFTQFPLTIDDGGFAASFTLDGTFAFKLDKAQFAINPDLSFYLDGEPTLTITGTAAVDPLVAAQADIGFSELTLAGSADLNLAVQATIQDPDDDGRITHDEIISTSFVDLVSVGFTDGPGNDVDISLTLTSDLAPASPVTVAYLDPDLSAADPGDGLDVQLGVLEALGEVDTEDVLGGMINLASSLAASQAVTDLDLPFVQQRLSDLLLFIQPVVDFIRIEGDAAVICGTNDADAEHPLPFGDTDGGGTIYCRALTTDDPKAGSVSWTIGNGILGANTTSDDTIGVAPGTSAQFTGVTGPPEVKVSWTDPADIDRVAVPRAQSAQDLLAHLTDPAIGGLGAGTSISFDTDPPRLSYRLTTSKTLGSGDLNPDTTLQLDFGDKLAETGLVGLKDAGSTINVTPGTLDVDVTFGVLLVDDEADINPADNAASPPGIEDRFYLQTSSGGEVLSLDDFSVTADPVLAGSIGFVEVGTVAPTSFSATEKVSADPTVSLAVTTGSVPVSGATALADALLLREFATDPFAHITTECNLQMSAALTLQADAVVGSATGGVTADWADVFPTGCTPDLTGLVVAGDLSFESNLQAFDLNPVVSGVHDGGDDSASLVDSGGDFLSRDYLIGGTLTNLTDGSSCVINSIPNDTTLTCTLVDGEENDWDDGDQYQATGNPTALLGRLLDAIEQLANDLDGISNGALDQKLPLIDRSPKELISQLQELRRAAEELRSPPAQVVCGLTDTAPPTGDPSPVPSAPNNKIFCHAETFGEVEPGSVVWSVQGATTSDPSPGSATANGSGGSADGTVGPSPTARAELTIDAGTSQGDYVVVVEYVDGAGPHTAEYPSSSAPTTLRRFEEALERKLGIPDSALGFDITDLGSDGTQDLVIDLGYGICTSGNSVISACAPSDVQVDKETLPLKLDLSGIPDIVGLEGSSTFELEYAARAALEFGIPLTLDFDPTKIKIVDSTELELEVGIATTDANLSANIGPLSLVLGAQAGSFTIASGSTHDGADDEATLEDGTANFFDIGVKSGDTVTNTADGSSCAVTAITATTLTCTLSGGTDDDWDNGDSYEVTAAAVGEARLRGGFRLGRAEASVDGSAFDIGDFISSEVTGELTGQDNSCGSVPDPDADITVDLTGHACARLSAILDVAGSPTYLGTLGFIAPDITDPGNWDAVIPSDLLDKAADAALDWTLILKALEQVTADVEDSLNGASQGTSIPIVGDALDAGADVAGALNSALSAANAVIAELEALGDATLPSVVQTEIEDVFNNTPLLLGTTTVTLLCTNPDATCNDTDHSILDIADARVTFTIGQGLGGGAPTKGCTVDCVDGVQLPFDVGLDGIPLAASGALAAKVGWSLLVDFGLSRADGPYLVVGGNDGIADHTGAELAVGASVGFGSSPGSCTDTLDNGPDSQFDFLDGFSNDRCVRGKLGFLEVVLRDGDDADATPNTDDDPSGVSLLATVDLDSSGGDRLTFSDLVSGTASLAPSLDLDAKINVRFRTQVSIGQSAGLPSLLGTFHMGWNGDFQSPRFENLYLDAGSFFSEFLGPIVGEVQSITQPFQPVLDTLQAPLPVVTQLSELTGGPPITLISLMEVATGADLSLFESLIAFISFANSLPTGGNLLIPLGASDSPGSFAVDVDAARKAQLPDSAGDIINQASKNAGTELVTKTSAKASATGPDPNRPGTFGVPGLTFPFMSDAGQIFSLLLGEDVTLVRYDIGTLEATAAFGVSFGPIFVGPVPITINIGGSATIRGRFAIGYDTSGLRKVLDGGSGVYLLDGIFIDDLDANGNDVPEISLTGRVFAGAAVDLVIVEAGVNGGIELTVDLNLDDSPDPDGKLRIEEIVDKIKNPICLFEVSGRLDAFLEAYAEIDLFLVSKRWTIEIVRITLLDFSGKCAPPDPKLAKVVGGDLRLLMGTQARRDERAVGVDITDETFLVRQLDEAGTKFSVSAFGLLQQFSGVTGVILADGDDGNDKVSLEPGVLQTVIPVTDGLLRVVDNNGNDTGPFSGSFFDDALADPITNPLGEFTVIGGRIDVDGDGGIDTDDDGTVGGQTIIDGEVDVDASNAVDTDDDGAITSKRLVPFTKRAVINGEGDNDTIESGGGNDLLTGGGGTDKILGGAGNDVVRGDGDNDNLEGGTGDDLVEGGSEDDNVSGGPGSDTVKGGSGLDSVSGGPGLDPTDPAAPASARDGTDYLFGDDGNDVLEGLFGNDFIWGDGTAGASFDADGRVTSVDATAACAAGGSATDFEDIITGGDGNDSLFGGGGPDKLVGNAGDDALCGNAGNDELFGDEEAAAASGGNDALFGGADDDVLNASGGHDRLDGEAGNDRLFGQDGPDDLVGGPGRDVLEGGEDNDVLLGDSGSVAGFGAKGTVGTHPAGDHGDPASLLGDVTRDNSLAASSGTIDCGNVGAGPGNADCLTGGNGDDLLFGEAGDDFLFGNDGADYMEGNAGTDEMRGGQQDDEMRGNAGADTMFGDSGDDLMYGDDDVLATGGDLADVMRGGIGSDYMFGNDGGDTMQGDGQDDRMVGGSPLLNDPDDGQDVMNGNAGSDVMAGDNATIGDGPNAGARLVSLLLDAEGDGDRMFGDTQSDRMFGQNGNDEMWGGGAPDYMEGNDGDDSMFGEGGDDDMIGGGSANDGVIDDDRVGDGLADSGETLMSGGPGQDRMAGDNALIDRTFDLGAPVALRLFDVGIVGSPAAAGTSGSDTMEGDADVDLMFGQGGGDTMFGDFGMDATSDSGSAAGDYMEGNDGDDSMFGEGGDDDMMGGGSANDGLIVDNRVGNGLLDVGETLMSGGPGQDRMTGDNALIDRNFPSGAPAPIRLFDVATTTNAVDAGTSGGDTMEGDADFDLMFGQGGGDTMYGDFGMDATSDSGSAAADYMEGNDGDDSMFGEGGDDDMMGGGSANDGLIVDNRVGNGLLDVGETLMSGGPGVDWMTGDNALIDRSFPSNAPAPIRLFDVQTATGPAVSPATSGGDVMHGDEDDDLMFGQGNGAQPAAQTDPADGADNDGDGVVDEDGPGWLGDIMFGDGGADYMEGNHGADAMFGGTGEDDMIGGGSANDGLFLPGRIGTGLLDYRDTMHGEGDVDFMTGDNASIDPADGTNDADMTLGTPRDVVLFDVQTLTGPAVPTSVSGGDYMSGGGADDVMFGQGNGDQPADAADPLDGVDNDRDGREDPLGADLGFDCLDGSDNDGDGDTDGADGDCTDDTDEDLPWTGDLMLGDDGDDYMEGNHGADWMFGDDGIAATATGAEDDMIGGGSANDGVIDADRDGTGLLDGHDVMHGEEDDDVMVGDNGVIRRTRANGGWLRLSGAGGFDLAVRTTTMTSVPEGAGAFGDDWMAGEGGADEMYGQLGGDYMEGNAGDDAMLGDLGQVTTNLLGDGVDDPALDVLIEPNPPFFSDIVFVTGTLYRLAELFSFNEDEGGQGGADTMLGGDGMDSMHGGPGADVMNGDGDGIIVPDPENPEVQLVEDPDPATSDEDHLYGGDGADVQWGGRDHDHLYGGFGDDYLDVRPRIAMEISESGNETSSGRGNAGANRDPLVLPADPPAWFTYGAGENYQDLDFIYGGWDADALQANQAGPGPAEGDRLVDWTGGYNVYYICPANYGEFVISRLPAPSVLAFLQDLAEGDGAFDPATEGTSGFREVALVFPNENRFNSHPPHPDHPGHFTCEPDSINTTPGG